MPWNKEAVLLTDKPGEDGIYVIVLDGNYILVEEGELAHHTTEQTDDE